MDLVVRRDGTAVWGETMFRCALGRTGIARDKREGDGTTPLGRFPMRRLLYRQDRIALPRTLLSVQALDPKAGWCDDPADKHYNQKVTLPYPASAEQLWREDALYDLIVPLGYNDAPVVAGNGSAIFLHIAKPDYGPTEGCVALALNDLIQVLGQADELSCVEVV